jgi:hypothetical protein
VIVDIQIVLTWPRAAGNPVVVLGDMIAQGRNSICS